MNKYLILLLSALTLSACSGVNTVMGNLYLGKFEPVYIKDLQPGLSSEEIQKRFGSAPSLIRKVDSPEGNGKQILIFQYENIVEEYMNQGPFWILFEKNSLITHGLGDAYQAEFFWYSAYYDFLQTNNKIKPSDAERSKYQKMKQMYQLTSYEDEYFTYRIVVAGKLERSEIDNDSSNYLIAQKKSEIDSKLELKRNNSIAIAQANELISLQRTALIMQSLRPVTRNCRTTQFGGSWYTNCY
jgi:hypothetical protein